MGAFSRTVVCCSLGAVVALQPVARVRSAARSHAMRPLGSAAEDTVAAEGAVAAEVEVVAAVAPSAPATEKIPLEDIVDGNWYEGTVTGMTAYGAFVNIGADADGLVHISQLAGGYTSDVASVVSVNDAVKVKVLSRDKSASDDSLRIALVFEYCRDGLWRRRLRVCWKATTCVSRWNSRSLKSGWKRPSCESET